MDERIGGEPFRDVLIVGGWPALVRTVGRNADVKTGKCWRLKAVSGRGLCLALQGSG